ncbi:MAG TPA: amidohydrolase [Parvularcula sp.]|nr:amidohydrolase [Parvularcula sp.]HBS32864.1 amidohydrolase [Parvularcula sp.]HBS33567.1 amidohydrolase [Parvularcula sp.]
MAKADEKARSPFRAACVQMRSGVDRARNVEAALSLIADAAKGGANFIATPEMTTVVDRNGDRLAASLPEGEPEEELSAFSAAASGHGVWLLIGSMPVRRSGRKLLNRSYFFGPDGAVIARYDKIHMFDVSLADGESWRESRIYESGAEAVAVRSPLATIGLSICYDLRFPGLYRALAQAGAEVIAVPAAFTKQTGRAHWRTLLAARAIECGAFMIAPAQGGLHADGRETFGHSIVIAPWGDILTEARGDEPGVIFADIDVARVEAARRQIPSLRLDAPALENPVRVISSV